MWKIQMYVWHYGPPEHIPIAAAALTLCTGIELIKQTTFHSLHSHRVVVG